MKPTESKLKSISPRGSRRYSLSLKDYATRSLLLNLEDIAPMVAIPPDGGWGWIIVIVSFLIMFCVDGIAYCFALFYTELTKDFNCEITDVAIVTSLTGGFYYLTGPLTCSGINRLGFRIIAVSGGVLAFLAFLGASLVSSLMPFLILVGFLGGLAFNLIYTPSVIAMGFYFERWRALALAISCCGSSLGVTVVPLVVVQFLEPLSWRTKFRIMAGIYGVCGLLTLTYKPIKATKVEIDKADRSDQVSRLTSSVTLELEKELRAARGGFFQKYKNTFFPTISEVSFHSGQESYKAKSMSRVSSRASSVVANYIILNRQEEEEMSIYLQPENQLDTASRYEQNNDNNNEKPMKCKWFRRRCSACCRLSSEVSFTTVNRPLYRDDIFYMGSVFALPQYTQHEDSDITVRVQQRATPSLAYTMSVTRAPTQRDLLQQRECVCCPEACVRVLATMLHFQMLKSISFIILIISGYLSLMGMYVVFAYLPLCAIDKGMEHDTATMLLSVIGIANTLGRAACGIVSWFPVLDALIISWVTIIVSGIAVVIVAFMSTSTAHIVISVIFGFTIASFAVLRPIIFVELFGLENLTNCFGLNMIFQALAAFSATPIANLILYLSDNFKAVFIFAGVAVVMSGLVLIPIKSISKWEHRKTKRVTFV